MPISDAYLTQLKALNEDMAATYARLGRLLSAVDNEVNAVYHAIERTVFDEASAFAAITMLQNALHRRRVVKDELAKFNPVRRLLSDNIDVADRKHRRAIDLSEKMRGPLNVNLKINDISEGFTL